MSKNTEIKAAAHGKRPYEKPRIVEYGDVREFTRGPGGSQQDKKGGLGFSAPG